MAHNLEPNYPSSSDDDEEELSGSEDEQTSGSDSEHGSDSDSDDEKKQTTTKPLIPPQSSNKPQKPDPSLSDSEESGSETDSDSPPKKSVTVNPNIKPVSSKPMEREEGSNQQTKSSKKAGSKPSSTPPPSKTKRPPPTVSTPSEKDAKKAKKSTATDEDSKKLFQRLWSEDDEIVILKGMIDYKTEKNGKDPVADMGAFHEYIKKALHVDVTRAQLVDKVRRLRKKYENNVSREKNGKDRSFSKSHEQKGYDLSKLIWGGSSNNHNSGTESKKSQNQKNGNTKVSHASTSTTTVVTLPKSNGVDDKEASTMVEVEKNIDISRFVQYGRNYDSPVVPEEIMKAGLELVKGSKREELEGRWKKLKMQELQLFAQRMELLKEQTALVLEAVNSSGI